MIPSCQIAPSKAQSQYPAHWWKHYDLKNKPAWEILPEEAKPGEVILSKRNELGILSNFSYSPFKFHGKKYNSIEGFWQMMLYPEDEKDPRFLEYKNKGGWKHTREDVSQMIAFEAKLAGEEAEKKMKEMGIDWVSFEGKRFKYFSLEKAEHYHFIREAMCEKLKQNSVVREVLLSTGDLILKPDHHQEEVAPEEWRYFKIWMEMRELLKKQNEALDCSKFS